MKVYSHVKGFSTALVFYSLISFSPHWSSECSSIKLSAPFQDLSLLLSYIAYIPNFTSSAFLNPFISYLAKGKRNKQENAARQEPEGQEKDHNWDKKERVE